jgi:hypothetical protein
MLHKLLYLKLLAILKERVKQQRYVIGAMINNTKTSP